MNSLLICQRNKRNTEFMKLLYCNYIEKELKWMQWQLLFETANGICIYSIREKVGTKAGLE